MAVISIIGCAGVGKSTLVRQLAALNRMPAFFEGEEGVFPAVVTENLITSDPVGRERWFAQQYIASLKAAHIISGQDLDAFVDNASPVTISSYAAISKECASTELRGLMDEIEQYRAHVTVVLTAKPELLAAYIAKRGRVSEEVVSVADQAERVQEQFVRAAEQYGALVLDRTGLDFHSITDLQNVSERIREFLVQPQKINALW